jgi:hypothetical protein
MKNEKQKLTKSASLPQLFHQLLIRRFLRLFVSPLLEDLQKDEVLAPRQARQLAVLADQLAVIVLRNDLIAVARWGVEV